MPIGPCSPKQRSVGGVNVTDIGKGSDTTKVSVYVQPFPSTPVMLYDPAGRLSKL